MLYANSTVVRPRVEHALTTQALGVEHNLTGTLTQNEEPHDGAQQIMMTRATTCTGKSLCFCKSSCAVSTHSVVEKVQRVQGARLAPQRLRERACAVITHSVSVKVQRVQDARLAPQRLRERACAVSTHIVRPQRKRRHRKPLVQRRADLPRASLDRLSACVDV